MIKRVLMLVCSLSFYSSSLAEDIYKYDIIGEKVILAFHCSNMAFTHSFADYPGIPKGETERLRDYGYRLGNIFLNEADPQGEYLHTSIFLIHSLKNKHINNDFTLGKHYGNSEIYMSNLINKGAEILTPVDISSRAYKWYMDNNCRLLGR